MRVGILGLGSIGSRHYRNAVALGHTVFGYDPMQTDYPSCERADVIEHSDAIIVASPTARHYWDLIDCLCYKKPCLVEKPIIAPHQMELRSITACLKRASSPVIKIGCNLRLHECVIKAKDWLRGIPNPRWAAFTVAQRSSRYKDAVISNWGSHEIDLALHLLGPATVRHCHGNNEIADLLLLHDNGCRSLIHCDYLTSPEQRGFTIYGDDQVCVADLVKRNISFNLEPPLYCSGSWDQNYMDEMAIFLSGDPKGKLATWQDGLAVVDIIIAAQKEMKK